MTMGGQSSEQLQQHARNAFQASEMLLRQAENAGGATDRFYRAANRYATTLRTLGGALAARDGSGAGAGVPATTGAGAGGDFMNSMDLTPFVLINHGVKEALDALQLKQMVRMMGGESAGARALMDHASQMDAASRQAIDALAMGDGSLRPDATGAGAAGAVRPGSTGPGGGMSGAVGGRGAALQMLVQQSREVLQAIRELDGNSGEGGAGRAGSGSGRDASGAGNAADRPR